MVGIQIPTVFIFVFVFSNKNPKETQLCKEIIDQQVTCALIEKEVTKDG